MRDVLRTRLENWGYEVLLAEDARGAGEQIRRGDPWLVVSDVVLPDASGLELLESLRAGSPGRAVILVTAYGAVDVAVEAMKRGARDFLTKPLDYRRLRSLIDELEGERQQGQRTRELETRLSSGVGLGGLVGNGSAMREVFELARRVAGSDAFALITGESGTGKDLAAKAVHYNSERRDGPFVNITCSALPDALLESELFGHEKGAFTDARQQKKGLFEQADGGTVFLDEIGEMSPILQAKLLRFLEEKTFRRVGGNQDLRVDVRVIAATNRDLKEEVKTGGFREDLFYRLNVLTVELPPLRERVGDIPLLAEYFTQRFADEFRKPVRGVDKEGLKLLTGYSWPGNVREFRNAIERAVLLCERHVLSRESFSSLNKGGALRDDIELPAEGVNLEQLERSLVVQALERTKGNQTQAAKLLGLNRDQIRYRIEKFGLSR